MEKTSYVSMAKVPEDNQKDYSLERSSSISKSLVLIVIYLSLEISKQLIFYKLTTSNHDKLPMPSTLLLVIAELTKLVFIRIYVQFFSSDKAFVGFSIRFMVPAFCYFISNMIYLYVITKTAPPIWIIFIQTKMFYSVLNYKFVLKKVVPASQIIGCLFIIGSIILTRMSEIYSGNITITFSLVCLSQVTALLSSIASLCVEVFLKNDERSFGEQQLWLYICGVIFGLFSLFISESVDSVISSFTELQDKPLTIWLLVIVILATACAGLCVPKIVKNLDTIVKDYLGAANNILLAFLTAVFFPNHFTINIVYIFSLAVLIIGILLYEKKPPTKEEALDI